MVGGERLQRGRINVDSHEHALGSKLAVIGLACRFPGAADVRAYWRNLVDGVESATELTTEELRTACVPEHVLADPRYVRRGFFVPDPTGFDAAYFGLTEAEAEATDPGHRLLIECVDSALIDAGYPAHANRRVIGLYAGAGPSEYGILNVARNRRLSSQFSEFALRAMNAADCLSAGVSYRLGLDGPSISVTTACSTALVAVHLACQALRSGECDIAVAGAVDLNGPYRRGYAADEDGLQSPSGRCRSFDAAADGTVFSGGVGVVVLRRLADALAARDHVYAVVAGSAVNNDGGERFNFTTPGWAGQARVVQRAMAAAGTDPSSLGYVECHAPGTPVGDFVEVSALAAAFDQAKVPQGRRCAIGSSKPNVGHAGAAAGAAGLIKTVLAVHYGVIPPTVNFARPNPDLDLPATPFYVNTEAISWPLADLPRKAGINSFGLGGTNVHVVIEQAPALRAQADSPGTALLPVAAKTGTALTAAVRAVLTAVLAGQWPLVDVAYTLQVGRQHWSCRAALLATTGSGGMATPRVIAQSAGAGRYRRTRRPRVAFMFPGPEAGYPHMGRELYARWPVFRRCLDECHNALGLVPGAVARPAADGPEAEVIADSGSGGTEVTLQALFAFEYALAALWMSWGIEPDVVLGYSTGEYVAACVAGMLDLETAARHVATCAQLLTQVEPGATLTVPLDEAATRRLVGDSLSVVSTDTPALTTVAGALREIERAKARGASIRMLGGAPRPGSALHSKLVEPILARYRAATSDMATSAPRRRIASSVTGGWLDTNEPTGADHWVRHVRQTVKFLPAAGHALGEADVFLEIGPGRTLSDRLEEIVRYRAPAEAPVLIRPGIAADGEQESLLSSLGAAWVNGLDPQWRRMWQDRPGRRVPLPGYPYERRPYCAEPDADLADHTA